MHSIKYCFLLLLFPILANAQVPLSLQEAVQKALVNNYDLRLQKVEVEIAEKNVNPALVGRRPNVDVNASYEVGWSDARVETLNLAPNSDGNTVLNLDGISNDIIVAPEVNMLLLDGGASKFRLEQLGVLSEVARLQLQQKIEQTAAAVSQTYIQMAQTNSLMDITRESIEFDLNRLNRAKQDAKYGTSSSLESLQIEVDLKTDSAGLRNLELAYVNAQRELNRLMGEALETTYTPTSSFNVNPNLNFQELEQELIAKNTLLKLNDRNIRLADINVNIRQSAFKPSMQAYANINFAYLQDNANFLQSNRVLGPNLGVRASYTIFDGGARKIQEQNAVLEKNKVQLERESIKEELLKELRNAFATYDNNLQQLRIEESNLVAFEQNLENLQNMYKLGTATNTDVRGAQLNLNAARNRINNYQFTIKQSEVQIYLLSGRLVGE